MPTYAFVSKYRPDIVGDNPAETADYSNALIRLKGGEAAIPAFKADLARVTGRSDIDVWGNAVQALTAVAAKVKGGGAFPFTPAPPAEPITTLEDLRVLPAALGGFLALLAFAPSATR